MICASRFIYVCCYVSVVYCYVVLVCVCVVYVFVYGGVDVVRCCVFGGVLFCVGVMRVVMCVLLRFL